MTDEAAAEKAKEKPAEAGKQQDDKAQAAQEKSKAAEAKAEESPFDVEAREAGWTPKEEFPGEPGQWLDSRSYLEQKRTRELQKLRRKTERLESTVSELKGHYSKVEENAHKRAVESLKAEKVKALEAGDHQRVVDVDEELNRMRDNRPGTGKPSGPDPAFTRWVQDNGWYESDNDMREFADFTGLKYAKENPDRTPQEVFEYATSRVRKQFPDKFRNPRRSDASPVEGAGRTASKNAGPRWSDLPEHYQQIGDKFVRQGVMTRDQYIADLVKLGEIKA
jgi:hypothetical protein